MRERPYSREAESALLGVLLSVAGEVWPRVQHLTVDAFHVERHRHVWRAMRTVERETTAELIDVLTVAKALQESGAWVAVGGAATLGAIGSSCYGPSQFEASLHQVSDLWVRRQTMDRLDLLEEQMVSGGMTPRHLERAKIDFATLSAKLDDGGEMTTAKDAVGLAIQRMQRMHAGDFGVRSGLADLDVRIKGLGRKEMTVLAARPGMGKSALAAQIAFNAAEHHGPVLFASFEMGADELALRGLSQLSGVQLDDLTSNRFDDVKTSKMMGAVQRLSAMPLLIDDRASTLSRLCAKAGEVKACNDGKLAMVVVDYLQLVKTPGVGENNKCAQVTHISQTLKQLARDLDTHVLAVSQLNRGVEGRADKRPVLSDLRDSGAIEQDADRVLFVYRDDYYNDETESPGIAEISGPKQRSAASFSRVFLRWDGPCVRFRGIE